MACVPLYYLSSPPHSYFSLISTAQALCLDVSCRFRRPWAKGSLLLENVVEVSRNKIVRSKSEDASVYGFRAIASTLHLVDDRTPLRFEFCDKTDQV